MDLYNELLNATIAHLEERKSRGARHVAITPEALAGLTLPATSRISSSPRAASPPPPRIQKVTAPPPQPPASVRAPGSAKAPMAAPLAPGAKAAAMRELRERALVCQKCPNLAAARQNVVFGVGNIGAELMFIGEAPGADEDIEGEPFVGKAGQLLTKIIQTMGLSREDVYIANILKCRPDTPDQDYGNRPPTREEMDRCLPYLHAQIDLIQPKVIVALGGTAVDGLFGKVPGVGITKMRGKWREYRGIPVMPTYHPSYLLRPNVNNVKRETWEDLLRVMERLGMPLSEKQRGYFLAKA
jgi:uracil-DNA glycosylase family 4